MIKTLPSLFGLTFLLFSGSSSFAQTGVLESSELLPPGSLWTMRSASNVAVIDTSVQGTGAVWDFSTLTPGTAFSIEVIEPASAPQIDMFPNADRVLYEEAGSRWTYFTLNDQQLDRIGMHIGTTTTIYDDPQTDLIFPLTSSSSNFDTWSTTGGTSGNISLESLGHGSLSLPDGFHEDVLLVRITIATTSNIKQYTWIDATNGVALAVRTIINDMGPGSVIYLSDLSTGIMQGDTQMSELRITSPVNDLLMVHYSSRKDLDHRIIDASGKVVLEGRLPRNDQQSQAIIEVGKLGSGVYLFTVQEIDNGKLHSVKFLKE